MRSRTWHRRRPFLHQVHPAPARSLPLFPAPFLPPRGPPASPAIRHLSGQRATHPPPARSLPAGSHTLSRNPLNLPFKALLRPNSTQSPVTNHQLLHLTLSP